MAEEILGYVRPAKRNELYDFECKEKIEKRNELRKQYLDRPTRSREEAYKTARRIEQKVCQKKKKTMGEQPHKAQARQIHAD